MHDLARTIVERDDVIVAAVNNPCASRSHLMVLAVVAGVPQRTVHLAIFSSAVAAAADADTNEPSRSSWMATPEKPAIYLWGARKKNVRAHERTRFSSVFRGEMKQAHRIQIRTAPVETERER